MEFTNKIKSMLDDSHLYRRCYLTYAENKKLVWIIISILFIRTFFVSYYHIPTSSMNPTLKEGDMMLVDKTVYNIKVPFTDIYFKINSPSRGDIVTFHYKGVNMVKRVVAVGGDAVQFKENRLYVNGKKVKLIKHSNEYVENKSFEKQKKYQYVNFKETTHDGIEYDVVFSSGFSEEHLSKLIYHTKEFKIPEDTFFMLGDNRNFSRDSRYIGTIHQKDIISRPKVVVLNYKELWSFITGEIDSLRFFIPLG
jgi:signal peptidase I